MSNTSQIVRDMRSEKEKFVRVSKIHQIRWFSSVRNPWPIRGIIYNVFPSNHRDYIQNRRSETSSLKSLDNKLVSIQNNPCSFSPKIAMVENWSKIYTSQKCVPTQRLWTLIYSLRPRHGASLPACRRSQWIYTPQLYYNLYPMPGFDGIENLKLQYIAINRNSAGVPIWEHGKNPFREKNRRRIPPNTSKYLQIKKKIAPGAALWWF